MNLDAQRLMAEALRRIKLDETFCPLRVGARIGLDQMKAKAAARALANAGVVELGFDFAAQFSDAFRKIQAVAKKPARALYTTEEKAPRETVPRVRGARSPGRSRAARD